MRTDRPHHSRRLVFGRYDVAAFSAFFAYASGTVVLPVALVTLARDLGFTLSEGGLSAGGALHLGRTVSMVLSMVFCGFLAGRWGKRRTLGGAAVLLAMGLLACAWAPNYALLWFALMVAGLGEGTIEGLSTPFVQDLHRDDPGRYINFTHGFWSVGVLATVLASGALIAAGVSWRWVTGAVALLALIPAGLLLLPPGASAPYPDHPESLSVHGVAAHAMAILRRPRFWLFFAAMFVAGGGEFCLTYWSASYIQMHFSVSALAGGAGVACFSAGMVLGRMSWGFMIRQHRLRWLIIYSALGGTVVTLALPAASGLAAVCVLLVLSGFATAPFWPSVQSYCADRLEGADTTMLFILLSCAGIPGCGFFTWLMGFLGNHAPGGLRVALLIVPACYLMLALLISLDSINACMAKRERKRAKVSFHG